MNRVANQLGSVHRYGAMAVKRSMGFFTSKQPSSSMGVSMDSSELEYGWAEVGLPVGRISGTAGLKLAYG